MQATPHRTDRAKAAILALAPDMAEAFGPMLDLGLAMLPDDQLDKLAADMESARREDGSADLDKITAIGATFGVTPEMVAAYQASK